MAHFTCKKERFGLLSDGHKVHLYTISNGKMTVSVTDYGCTLTSIRLPAKRGTSVDVLLGYSSLDGYINSTCCFGPAVGRFANRISGAAFTLDGIKYELDKNDNGKNMLHGGFDRWEKKVWKAKKIHTENGMGVQFKRTSRDGEQGFPGTVKVCVTYTLSDDNVLALDYVATTDKATPLNITNHAYFNLKGHNGGSIFDQELHLDCSHYLEVDDELIPTGEQIAVTGTPFDFTKGKLIGRDIEAAGGGYDHCFCLAKPSKTGDLVPFATLKDPESGRQMHVATNQPGVQFYSANFIEGEKGKEGVEYHKHGGLCLETQGYPDAPNKPQFPSCILRPGETYHHRTTYGFVF